jgi:hypothetical protein
VLSACSSTSEASIYGNTRAVAEAIGERAEVLVVNVAEVDAGALQGANLLVVGGPTHMHGLSSSLSRRLSARAGEEDGHVHVEPHAADGPGLRGWLSDLSGGELGAAAFDTRLDRSPAVTGAAARGIARRLERRGCRLVAEPESFFVVESEGPLEDGEAARARAWGATLAAAALSEAVPAAIAPR